ncbi:MAG TPA: 1-deoxy-D-xylulose-5-phosphate reductoisomerase, partial [Armatimonadota bacterium]|nr:1-deoxy-D-xylulose-5-phosphate reductoisomerase [Armatimonadota bacterium]
MMQQNASTVGFDTHRLSFYTVPMKSICLLGSTGSIGRQTLDIVAAFPDRFTITALTAHSNVDLLIEQARQFHAPTVVIMREDLLPALREGLAGTDTRILVGMPGLLEVASAADCDLVVTAMVGSAGLLPLLAAAEAGKMIALANKEPLVAAGHLVMDAISGGAATLLPVDSEPSAIFQCLQGQDRGGLSKLLITASGGALKHLTSEELNNVTPEQALKHPTWQMGCKITVDSATLMNKGLEVIEAHWLFGVPLRNINIVIHPQSIVHSLIEFQDGSLLAQLGKPTMRTPIQYALGYPERLPHNWAPLDLMQLGTISFSAPDFSRFPAPMLARQAAIEGGTMPTCLNAANEIAVQAFLEKRI